LRRAFGVLAIGAGNPNQLERSLNIVSLLNEKADPTGMRKNMMGGHAAAFPQKQVAIRSTDKAIKQTIPMDVTHLFSTMEETDTAEAMESEVHAGQQLRFLLYCADGA
jgi:hypothetical protein